MNRSVVIQKLETKAKRKIIISDIHGNLDLYQALLKKIKDFEGYFYGTHGIRIFKRRI